MVLVWRAAAGESHKVDGLINRHSLSHSFWRLEAQDQCVYRFASFCQGESVSLLSPGFWCFAGNLWCSGACRSITPISVLIHLLTSSPCVHAPVLCPSSPPYKDTCGLGPILIISLLPDYLCKDTISKYSHILRYWGLELQHIQ